MPAFSILVLLGGVPFLCEDPLLRERLLLLYLGGALLVCLHYASRWLGAELRVAQDAERARRLATLARALGDAGQERGNVSRLGRAALLTGTWRGRPFRLLCDPRSGLAWELLAAGHRVDLHARRSRWLGPLAPVRATRGGPDHAWRLPQPGRAEALATHLLLDQGLRRLELSGDVLRLEGPLRWRALELDRLLQVLQALGGIADLVAPRAARAAAPAPWREARAASRCPFCRDVLRGGAAWDCPACRTVHHAECAREAGGCTVHGCEQARARPGRTPLEKAG